jgi:hypothetical protein
MLFAGLLSGQEEHCRQALDTLREAFGPVIRETPPLPWHSEFYREELGPGITRRFVFFERLIAQDDIVDIKLATRGMEAELSAGGRRTVNIDPGYLTLAKVVLATTKDYVHRIYLGRGIFAEVTLSFRAGRFHPRPFAYRDYRDEASLALFGEMREEFRDRLP